MINKSNDINQQEDFWHSKKWYKSKTIIFNLILAIFTGMATLLPNQQVQDLFGEHYSVILIVVTIGNLYLRTITNKAVKL